MKQTVIQEMISEFNKELDVAINIANDDKIKTIKHLINIASKYLQMEKEENQSQYHRGYKDGVFTKFLQKNERK
jgi:hypothetical protein